MSDTDLTFSFALRKGINLSTPSLKNPLPFQLQIRYTKLDGSKFLRLINTIKPTTFDRTQAEETDMPDTAILGVNCIHRSAEAAHKGDYQAARINMISIQRLFQRLMKSREHQKDYLNFILQGEKLDSFMRLAQQEETVQTTHSATDRNQARKTARDDTASKNIYTMKSLNKYAFKAQQI